MSSAVLDTSVLMAHINDEPINAAMISRFRGALLCSVNFAELISVLLRQRRPLDHARKIVELSEIAVVNFDIDLAEAAGVLIARTRHRGLSLGDCACLALALRENLPVLTADRPWRDLDVGVDIQFIR